MSIGQISEPRDYKVFIFFNFFLIEKNLVSSLAVLGLRCCVGISLVAVSEGVLSSCGAWASHCGGFCCGARPLGRVGFGSCGIRAVTLAACEVFLD